MRFVDSPSQNAIVNDLALVALIEIRENGGRMWTTSWFPYVFSSRLSYEEKLTRQKE
jgi:hypothetical protein